MSHDDDVPENPDEQDWADELAESVPPLPDEELFVDDTAHGPAVPEVDTDLLLPVNAEDTPSGGYGGDDFPLEAPEED